MRRYDICFHPGWWNQNLGIDFSRSFWDEPEVRINADLEMRRYLFEKFGKYGLGEEAPQARPILGSDQTACGYLFSEMLGCRILYASDSSPQVLCANLSDSDCFALEVPDFEQNEVWSKIQRQIAYLEKNYGYVESHINLMGVQNMARDLRGQRLFLDYYDPDSPAAHLLDVACQTMLEAGRRLKKHSKQLSAGVTNIVRHVCPDVFLTSNCSVEMVSQATYEEHLLAYDVHLAQEFVPFGIHHCGKTMEHVIGGYAKVLNLAFVEVGAFSDLAAVASALPEHILINARYSPVRLMHVGEAELRQELEEMIRIVPGKRLSVSCVGIDSKIEFSQILLFLETCQTLFPD